MPHHPEFSEFSYGYALVDNLAHSGDFGGVAGAPRFLSLLDEGAPGGGFDVALDFAAWPFFLQFKIPQIMVYRSKLMPAGFHPPYFRMHLRTDKVNASGMTQHEQLMALEAANPLTVFYVAPAFETTIELDHFYRRGVTPDHSEWFPLAGFDSAAPLTRDPHRIVYQHGSVDSVVQSKPFPFKHRLIFEQVKQRLAQRKPAAQTPFLWLDSVEREVARVLEGRTHKSAGTLNRPSKRTPSQIGGREREVLPEAEKIEFYARARRVAQSVRTRLDAEMMLIVA